MLSEQQMQEFERNGFINAGKALSLEEVDELGAELDRILDIGPDGFGPGDPQPVSFRDMGARGGGVSGHPVWQIVNIWEASDAFRRLMSHPFLVRAVSQLTGHPDLMVWHDQIQYKPAARGGSTRWHQDAPLWPIIKPMTPVSAWVPLDDADEENGCMWMVPGSFRWGNQIEFLRTQGALTQLDEFGDIDGFSPPEGAEISEVRPRPLPVKRGEVSFHHSLNWHGSPFNRSERPRRAIAIHYMTGDAVFDASGEHLMKQFVEVADGGPMSAAGPHFPEVCKGGEPLPVSEPAATGGD